jgi:ectoine hydroxylase-related dioxygenase (phytanoyl-CoA dioxygenase family)
MDHTDRGYAVYEDVFERGEMIRALDSLSAATVRRTKAGARHVLRLPEVCTLANDPRLTEIARQFLGGGAVPFRATLFDKSPAANWLVVWHQDTALPLRARVAAAEWGPWSTKAGILYAHAPAWALERVVALRVSLDDSSPANGPLRVLPNSHREGVLTDGQIERLSQTVPSVDCVAPAGGVVVMRPLTVHASSKSLDNRPRRVLHIEYADSARLSSDIELAFA